MILGLIIESRLLAADDGFDMSLPSRREALETYIYTGKGDAHEIIEGDKYPPVFGYWELRRLVLTLLPMALTHNVDTHNEADVPVAYNKGDDWFGATLGDPMVYTSAIYLGQCHGEAWGQSPGHWVWLGTAFGLVCKGWGSCNRHDSFCGPSTVWKEAERCSWRQSQHRS